MDFDEESNGEIVHCSEQTSQSWTGDDLNCDDDYYEGQGLDEIGDIDEPVVSQQAGVIEELHDYYMENTLIVRHGPIDTSAFRIVSQQQSGHPSDRMKQFEVDSRPKAKATFITYREWWDVIKSKPELEHIKVAISRTLFIPLIDIHYEMTDRALQIALVERWWPSTHTFHFPSCEIGVTPLDFTMK